MKCPGQDTRYWDGKSIYEVKCPKCGYVDEFFKDESSRKCRKCGYKIINPEKDFGCATYCKFAEQCLGELPEGIIEKRKNMLKDRVSIEMRTYFANDYKRINHANKVAEYAEKIAKQENADLAIVLSAAYLHDIGIKKAEEKFNSTLPKYQEQEGPPIAKEILKKLDADDKLIDEVCKIISRHHHPEENENKNFISVFDADQIVNIEEDYHENNFSNEEMINMIDKILLSESGKNLANEVLLKK